MCYSCHWGVKRRVCGPVCSPRPLSHPSASQRPADGLAVRCRKWHSSEVKHLMILKIIGKMMNAKTLARVFPLLGKGSVFPS